MLTKISIEKFSQERLVNNVQHAIKENDMKKVRKILLKYLKGLYGNEDYYPEKTSPILFLAAHCQNEKIIQLLVENGADVNEKVNSGFSTGRNVLCEMSRFMVDNCSHLQKIFKCCDILIRHGADVNHLCDDNNLLRTPLQCAIHHGNVPYAEYLMKNGAKIHAGPEWDIGHPINSILRAPMFCQQKMLQLFIDNGLDTKFEKKFRDFFVCKIIDAVTRKLYEIDVVGITKILLKCGVSANDILGNTPLVMAAMLQDTELVSNLIKNGANVNEKCLPAASSLYVAVHLNNEDLVNILLSNGADINARDHQGETALHVACTGANKRLIKILIHKGADLSVENKYGKTPFFLLHPSTYETPKVPCINIMIKEIAKLNFFDDSLVSQKDILLMNACTKVKRIFHRCTNELFQMLRTEFYPGYPYIHILLKTKNLKKLANLAKNKEFVSNFETHLIKFSNYVDDLRTNFDEIVQIRDRSLMVEERLSALFHGILPGVVIRILAQNLSVEDLPLE